MYYGLCENSESVDFHNDIRNFDLLNWLLDYVNLDIENSCPKTNA